jgi:hypothetical protein
MADLDKQIRLRATAEEKSHMETAAKDAGYENLSDYLRHMLFDQHVLIVGDSRTEFIMVPAWSTDEEARTEAKLNLQGLLALTAALAEGRDPQAPADASECPVAEPYPFTSPQALPPEAPAVEEPVVGGGVDQQPPVAAVADDVAPVQQQLPADLHPVAAVPPAPLGGAPLPTEDFDSFMLRRGGELQLAGRTPLIANAEAEAEWRRQLPPSPTNPVPAAAPPALDPVQAPPAPTAQPLAAFCPHCGTASTGTPFCAGCGARLA